MNIIKSLSRDRLVILVTHERELAKFYSDRPVVNKQFETSIHNLFVGGDGAGITRGLAQAGANGIKIARSIIERKRK